MTHSVIVPAHITGGFMAGCVCGYRTRIYPTSARAMHRATCHVRLSTEPPDRRLRTRPAIDIDTAAEQFMALLFSGVDEGPIAARGGWPR